MLTRRFTVGVVLAAALATATGCGGDDEDSGGGGGTNTEEATPAPTQAAADGKQLFSNTCGGCHTLADANTNGQVGPNLDDLAPDKARVLAAIKAGPGPMPENLYEGAEAEAVAEYVSTSAGSGG
jgi:mono/diheme cytochrome c family protein